MAQIDAPLPEARIGVPDDLFRHDGIQVLDQQ